MTNHYFTNKILKERFRLRHNMYVDWWVCLERHYKAICVVTLLTYVLAPFVSIWPAVILLIALNLVYFCRWLVKKARLQVLNKYQSVTDD